MRRHPRTPGRGDIRATRIPTTRSDACFPTSSVNIDIDIVLPEIRKEKLTYLTAQPGTETVETTGKHYRPDASLPSHWADDAKAASLKRKNWRRCLCNCVTVYCRWDRCLFYVKRLLVGISLIALISLMFTTFVLLSLSISVNYKYRNENCQKIANSSMNLLEHTEQSLPRWNMSGWEHLRLNQFRVLGTHNSYHLSSSLPIAPHQYSHPPLDEQLGWYDHGVRQVELDIHLLDDTFVVYHLHFVDDSTTCYCLVECFQLIREWSILNPLHFPLLVFLEIKAKIWEDVLTAINGFGDKHLEHLETAISTVFPHDVLITPDIVRGDYELVRDALQGQGNTTTGGWPKLAESLGKVMFVWLDDVHEIAKTVPSIVQDPSLKERLFFIASKDQDAPTASVIVINDPRMQDYKQEVRRALDAGMMVRSMSDSPNNLIPDPQRFLMLLAGGAQIITTDFECVNRSSLGYVFDVFKRPTAGVDEQTIDKTIQDAIFDLTDVTNYCETLPSGRPFECNPITASTSCMSEAFFDPRNIPTRTRRLYSSGEGWLPWFAGVLGM